jgi:4-hydroxybenzoate polyprenyltransferase
MVEAKRFLREAAMRDFSFKENFLAYIVSMRWNCSLISTMAAWLGIVFSGAGHNIFKQALTLSIAFTGWGINQVINDCLCLAEDKINVPKRPTVAQKLNIKFAVILSVTLSLLGLVVTYKLNKEALALYLFVFGMNIGYGGIKRMPLLGNIIFGLLVAPCVYYGAMCASGLKLQEALSDSRLASLTMLVWLVNFVLCFFYDFKDYKGDKETKIKTMAVSLGLNKAKYLGLMLVTVPFLFLLYFLDKSVLTPAAPDYRFPAMITLSFLCFLYPALVSVRNPQGKNAYFSLKWIVMGTVLFETALIGLANPQLALSLFIFNIIYVWLLSGLYLKNSLI